MTVVGITIQQHDGTILFQNVRDYLTPDKAHLASKAFNSQIVNYDESRIQGSVNHLTGSIVVLNMYRIHYLILAEIFILAISQANDNPYEASIFLARSKRVLQSVSRDYSTAQILKKYTEISFALERVLYGEDGVDILTQRVQDVQPHNLGSAVINTSSTGQNIISSMTPFSSGIQLINTPISLSGKLIDSTLNTQMAPTLSNWETIECNNNSNNSNNISFEGVKIPEKVFSVSDPSLPKIDKHIYDPPQTVKWGTTSVPPVSSSSSRVTNRIMFTLRHPNANQQKENNNSNLSSSSPNGSFSSDTNPTSPDILSAIQKDITATLSLDGSDDPNPNESNNKSSQNPESTPPTTAPRKFSLSMGTFKNTPLKQSINNSHQQSQQHQQQQVLSPDITSKITQPPTTTTIISPEPEQQPQEISSSPTITTKAKMNFLQF